MNVASSSPVAIIQRWDETALVLRLNQRITAEVLQVSGDQVVLDLDGTQVLARLTSPDQSAALAERRSAQFVVRDQTGHTLVLQLISPSSPSLASTPNNLPSASLIPELLHMAGLPVDDNHVMIAIALMRHNLPVTKDLIEEIKDALNRIGTWGEREAMAATSLREAGLILSPATISLVLHQTIELAPLIATLIKQIRNLAKQPDLSRIVEVLEFSLETMLVEWTEDSSKMALQLKRSLAILGRPFEADIYRLLLESPSSGEEAFYRGLLALGILRRELQQKKGYQDIIDKIDRVLNGLRLMHFMNTAPDIMIAKDEWLTLSLPLLCKHTQRGQDDDLYEFPLVHLKIAYSREGEQRYLDPEHTHIRFHVEISREDRLEVDLSLVSRMLGIEVFVSNDTLKEIAQFELTKLESGLEQMGFKVKNSMVNIKDMLSEQGTISNQLWQGIFDLDVEV